MATWDRAFVAIALSITLAGCGQAPPASGTADGSAPRAAAYARLAAPTASVIEQCTGLKGKLDEASGVFTVKAPRTDLQVTVAGVKMTPAMGLTSWAAFSKAGAHTAVMGDMVMTEDQVNTVMSAALDNGLEVTALHNHFFWDSPKVMFMHISGMGDEAVLATAVGKVFAAIKGTSGGKGRVPTVNIDARTTLDPKPLEAIIGVKGDPNQGQVKFTVGRTTQHGGMAAGKAMGVNTWAAFAGSDEQAVVDGDFAMYDDEVQSVLKTLRAGKINIVALHNHMLGETPRVTFLHFWGVGPAADLARTFKAALDRTRYVKPAK
jgi:hypothetical protein